MKLEEIAQRINTWLEKFEAENNPEVNGYKRFYHPFVNWSGRYIYVCYICYQNSSHLSKKEAEGYLAWLDAGNVGKHYDYERSILQS